jgi:tetrahydromethanopterin:alpha-L-glutamate ligase
MKIGVLGIPGKWSSEHLADTIATRTGERLLISAADICFDFESRGVFWEKQNLSELDALIIKKVTPTYSHDIIDRLGMLGFLADQGVRVFSSPLRIARAANRLTGTLDLAQGGIPIPPTIVTESVDEAVCAVQRFEKVVLKPLFTSKARGMEVITDGPHAAAAIADFRNANPIMYVQKFIEFNNRDYGLVFLGGKYVATYARVGAGDHWTTTTHFGGKYQPFQPDQSVIDMASRAQALFGLDFTCVDVAITPEGPFVFEVSAFGGFRGLKEAHGIDAAALYADYVIEQLGR